MNHPDSTPEFQNEIEHGHNAYTTAELLELSQLNAQALILAVFSAVAEPDDLNQLVSGISEIFSRGWDTSREWSQAGILDALLTNYRSLGATVESWNPEDEAPNATLSGLPDAGLIEILDISATAFRPMLVVSERLVDRLGFELEWSHDIKSGRIRLQVNERS